MKKVSGLRERWLRNTVGVILALGMVCVMLVTAVFATQEYRDMQADVYHHAQSAVAFVSPYRSLDREAYYQACMDFTQSFVDENGLELQFVDESGQLVVASIDHSGDFFEATTEIEVAMQTRGPEHYLGRSGWNERILAVSAPIVDGDGTVIGVFRCVTSTKSVDRQICLVFVVCFFMLMLILAAVYISSHYFLQSVMVPLQQINETARRIANGSYGTQIQTKYADEIGDLADTINELSVKISQNEKMQADFISQLSHELRTPLTVINGWSETLLADEEMDSQTRQGMKIISGEANRLTEMVMELLDFTRIQDGRMTLAVEPADIRAEFEDTIFMYGSRSSQEGIKLHYTDTDEDIPEIPCDAQRLRQVFLNILDNASKHGGSGGRIDASIKTDRENVIVRIRDYGPGIPEDEIPLVKKKFYKGSSSVRGTGIGLAVCDEIVELHGGTLTLENAEGGGTVVTVALPMNQ